MNIDFGSSRSKKDERYVLLFGGRGCEREVSISGACEFLKTAERIGFDFLPIFIDSEGDFYIFRGRAEDVSKISTRASRKLLVPTALIRYQGKSGFLSDGEIIGVKLVFPLLHGDFGEDGVIQGLLTALGINFVGADNFTGALTADKVYTKIIARECGVPTLPEVVLTPEESFKDAALNIENRFGFPAFVKPVRLGSSIGASVAKSKQELTKSLKTAFKVSKRVMVEPAIFEKRELECAFYNIGKRRIIAPPGEIRVGSGFYDFDLKYKSGSLAELSVRAQIPWDVRDKIISYSERLANALALRHMARLDYFLLPGGSVYFNEVNTMPGMTGASLYPAMLCGEGLGFSDFILSLKEVRD